MEVNNNLSAVINYLYSEGLDDTEISTAFNISPTTVRMVKRSTRKPIDKEEFIKFWKRGLPYSLIAKHFKITISTAKSYKSIFCRDISRIQFCQCCGNTFKTTRSNRQYCDDCQLDKKEFGVNIYYKKKRMKRGDVLQARRIEREQRALDLKERKEYEKRMRKIEEEF